MENVQAVRMTDSSVTIIFFFIFVFKQFTDVDFLRVTLIRYEHTANYAQLLPGILRIKNLFIAASWEDTAWKL